MLVRARENFFSTLSKVGSYITPSMLSFGTSFSTAGQSLFGTMKICDWVFGMSYDSPEDEPHWAAQVREAAYAIVIAANVIIILDTRYPAIFRSYFKKTHTGAVVPAPQRTQLEQDLDSIYNEESELFLQPDTDAEDQDSVYIIEVVRHYPAHDSGQQLAPEIRVRKIREQDVQAVTQEVEKKSMFYHFARGSISNSLKFLGFSSITFASINTYLGSITLFEYLGVNEPFLKYTFSAYTVASKFYSSYSYVYKTATVRSAEQLARWIMNEPDPLADPAIPRDRLQDLKNYMSTIALSSFNIISSPFLAFYSTMMTLYKIPFVKNYDDFIFYFAGASTFSSFTNDVISKSPSVHKLYIAWRSRKEDGSLEIRALEEADLKWLNAYNHLIVAAGINDSIATGANIVVSVINTSNHVFDIGKYNPELIAFASTCGISAAVVNYAFSVRRGHRDFLKHEVYPYLARNNYLSKAEAIEPLPDIREKEIYKIMPAHDKHEKADADDFRHVNGDASLRVSLLNADAPDARLPASPILHASSPHTRLSVFYRNPVSSRAIVEDITPENAYNALAL